MINFSDECSLSALLKIEKNSLKATLEMQKNLNKQILMYMKNFIGNLEITLDFDPENKFFKYLIDSTSALNKSNENIQAVQKLLTKLDEFENSKKDLLTKTSPKKINAEIKTLNSLFTEQIDIIYDNTTYIESFIHEFSKINLAESFKELDNIKEEKIASSQTDNKSITISSDELNFAFIENTLIISEFQGIVILPYTLDLLKKILFDNNDKYKTIEEIIENFFTIPISNYRLSAVARFKEAYKLMRKKEKASKIKAFNLASELFLNYNLHPAIITACNSLYELDIYLACLEDNTLDEFHFFDIKYEIPPATVNVKNSST